MLPMMIVGDGDKMINVRVLTWFEVELWSRTD